MIWDENGVSGSMEIYDIRFTSDGSGEAESMLLEVPLSGTFRFTPLKNDNEMCFSVADRYRFTQARGTNIDCVSLDKTGKIDLSGNSFDFEVAYSVPDASKPLQTIIGSGKDGVSVQGSENSIAADEVIGKYTVSSIDSDGNTSYTDYNTEALPSGSSETISEFAPDITDK